MPRPPRVGRSASTARNELRAERGLEFSRRGLHGSRRSSPSSPLDPCPLPRPLKRHARAEMPEPPRLDAARRSRLHEPAILGTSLVHGARETPRRGDVERQTTAPRISHEAPARPAVVLVRVPLQQDLAHALVVRFEEMNRPRPVMAAAAAGDAVRAPRIRLSFDGREPASKVAHAVPHVGIGHFDAPSRGPMTRRRSRSCTAVARWRGSRRRAE
jgi:hypothetical protein